MTMQQAAINHAAILTAAARLEAKGYQGDAAAFCESLIVGALADGYREIEPVPPPRAAAELGGPGHREFQEAKEALAQRSKR